MRPHGSPEQLQRRREQAIQLLERGHRPCEVARMLRVDRRSVRRWKAAYRRKGQAGIAARPAPGRPPRLQPRQKRRLESLLLKGARAAGFGSDVWTCARVSQIVQDRFGVHYHLSHVWRLLRSLGWSCQKPARRPIERDEALIAQWVRKDWPALKKSP